jgi:hypothetical protein
MFVLYVLIIILSSYNCNYISKQTFDIIFYSMLNFNYFHNSIICFYLFLFYMYKFKGLNIPLNNDYLILSTLSGLNNVKYNSFIEKYPLSLIPNCLATDL